MLIDHKNKIPVLIIAVITGVSFYFLSYNYNLGFSPDSVSYFEVVKSLKAGKGFTGLDGELVNHWPPGYPLFISFLSGILGISSMLAGTIGNALIGSLTILSLFKVFRLYSIPARISYLLILLYLLSPLASIYLWYLSEGLFILLVLVSFIMFSKWNSSTSVLWLIFSGLILGISILVRYAGVGFVTGYIVFLIYKYQKAFNNLCKHLFIFFTTVLVPILPWVIYTRIEGHSSHDRNFDFEMLPISKLQEMTMSFGTWIFGNMIGLYFLGAAIIILIGIYLYSPTSFTKFKKSPGFHIQLFKLPIILTVVYISFILFTAMLLDHAIPLSNRIFSPVYPLFLLILGLLLSFLTGRVSIKKIYLFMILMMISYSFRSIPVYIDHYKNGSGFTSEKFRNSPTIHHVEQNLKESILYTNDIFLLKIFTSNPQIKQLPLKEDNFKLKKIDSLLKENNNAVIVYLDSVNWRNYVMDKKSIIRAVDKGNILHFRDGIVINP